MKIVFISNCLTHHQKPFSEAMDVMTGHNFYFIETKPMRQERKDMGWELEEIPSYVINNYEDNGNEEHCKELIDEADVVIIGSAPYERIENRLKHNKLTFVYSERLYKKGDKFYKFPKRLVSMFLKYGRYRNLYLLCASAYASADYARTLTFKNKAFKWGYFPETKHYDNIDNVIEVKKEKSILWVARFIDWKHPEIPVMLAQRLKKDGYTFKLNMVGNGVMLNEIRQLVKECGLSDVIDVAGAVKPDKVREFMDESEIFLFTSDFNEGWGAVLNEAMNSGCACVASHAIGAAPFLIDDGENGIMYENGNLDDLYEKVKYLLDNDAERKKMSKKAYQTITEHWSADMAAERLINFCERILSGEDNKVFSSGLCSKVKELKNNWYRKNNIF